MEQIDVKILDRDYRLAVSGETKPQLLEAVQMVDEKMRAIREAGRISGIDRIAVMAALQLAHELLGAQSPVDGTPKAEILGKIRKMRDDLIDAVRAAVNALRGILEIAYDAREDLFRVRFDAQQVRVEDIFAAVNLAGRQTGQDYFPQMVS